MHASDIITNVTKTKHERHGINVQLVLNMWSAGETKTKSFGKSK